MSEIELSLEEILNNSVSKKDIHNMICKIGFVKSLNDGDSEMPIEATQKLIQSVSTTNSSTNSTTHIKDARFNSFKEASDYFNRGGEFSIGDIIKAEVSSMDLLDWEVIGRKRDSIMLQTVNVIHIPYITYNMYENACRVLKSMQWKFSPTELKVLSNSVNHVSYYGAFISNHIFANPSRHDLGAVMGRPPLGSQETYTYRDSENLKKHDARGFSMAYLIKDLDMPSDYVNFISLHGTPVSCHEDVIKNTLHDYEIGISPVCMMVRK